MILANASKKIIREGGVDDGLLRDGAEHFEDLELSADQSVWTTRRRHAQTGHDCLSAYALSQGYGRFTGLGWILLLEYNADTMLRPVARLGGHIRWIAIAATLLAVAIGGATALSLSRRIRRLSEATVELGRGNLDATVACTGRDELTNLATAFNSMAGKLKAADDERSKLQDQLVESSRIAGKAEVATGVLHNVGNVLNSINTSAGAVIREVRGIGADDVKKVAALVEERSDDLGTFVTQDERGRHLPAFLKQLSAHLEQGQQSISEELSSLVNHVDHIKRVISMQQANAKTTAVVEPVKLTKLIDEALSISEAGLDRHGIDVVRQYEVEPTVNTDRHMTLQILVNLISNAKAAMKDNDPRTRQLVFRIEQGDQGMVRIVVQDTGVGITAEHLTKIFAHGFTTRKDGHGFGLHSASLAAKSLGGSLSAYSDGPGSGAAFYLDIPQSVGVMGSR